MQMIPDPTERTQAPPDIMAAREAMHRAFHDWSQSLSDLWWTRNSGRHTEYDRECARELAALRQARFDAARATFERITREGGL